MKKPKRPDLWAGAVFIVLAVTQVIVLYFMAYAPEDITFWGPWPAWYVVCGWGFALLNIASTAYILFNWYDESDFTVDESEIIVQEKPGGQSQ